MACEDAGGWGWGAREEPSYPSVEVRRGSGSVQHIGNVETLPVEKNL